MSKIEISSGNVYADLGDSQADEMLVKARLAFKIGEIIKQRHLTQVEAADLLGLTQPKLSGCSTIADYLGCNLGCYGHDP